MMAAIPLPWEELLDLCCNLLTEPARFENEANPPSPHAQAEGANAEDKWRTRAGLTSGPPPDPKTPTPPVPAEGESESSGLNPGENSNPDLIPHHEKSPANFFATAPCVLGDQLALLLDAPGDLIFAKKLNDLWLRGPRDFVRFCLLYTLKNTARFPFETELDLFLGKK